MIGFTGRWGNLRGPQRPAIIVIGASAGGLSALETLLPVLPPGAQVPLAIVQHRNKETGAGLRDYLQRRCHLPVVEPDDKEPIEPGKVFLAPPDYHLLIEKGSFALSTAAPAGFARPSIDLLFETAADAYEARVAGFILTGASRDGAAGLARIKRRGGVAVVQEPGTAEARVMPEAALAATPGVDLILPIEQIAALLADISLPEAA